MAFQRSYSKVWWGSDNQLQAMTSAGSSLTSGGFYSYQHQQHHKQLQQPQLQQHNVGNNTNSSAGYHSLDYNNFKSYSGNLSRIQEVDDEHNISKLSWEKHDSPGSLRSQDSGFSDNEESHSTRSRCFNAAAVNASPSGKSVGSAQSFASPTSSMTSERIATPPTVVRRVGKSEFYSPLVNVSRRISFSGSPASAQTLSKDKQQQQPEASFEKCSTLLEQLDSMQLVEDDKALGSVERISKQLNFETPESDATPCKCSSNKQQQRRRRRVSRKPTKPLSPTSKRTASVEKDNNSSSDEHETQVVGSSLDELAHNLPELSLQETVALPPYNNETVYLGEAPPPYNNETIILGGVPYNNETVILGGIPEHGNNNSTLKYDMLSPLKEQRFMASTSTPKAAGKLANAVTPNYDSKTFLLACHEYENPLLNGHTPALQAWLGDLRMCYEHEVMSTLQTKSIAAEAFKNLTITTNTVAKLIRQLQQRAQHMQFAFERIESIILGEQSATLAEAFNGAEQLVADVAEFSNVLERRVVFFTDSRSDRRRYEQNIEQIKLITKDTRISLEKQHYINLESLLEDLQVLKRVLLITLRLVFEKLVGVIVQSIEQGRCDLMLRANINMIATLTNIDYDGFASLSDAFVQNEAVRTLLMICLEHKVSAVRALSLRALATICCAPAAIAQLGTCGGIEILRDILLVVEGESESSAVKRVSDIERREAVSLLTQITAAWHGPEHRVNGMRDCAESIIEGLTALMLRTGCAQTLLLCAAAMNNLSRIEVTAHYSIMSNDSIFKWIEAVQQREDGVSIFLYEQIVAMLYNMSLNKKCHSHLANGSIINFITFIYQAEFHHVYDTRAQRDAQRRTIKTILHTLTRLVHESSLGPELLELQGMPVFLRRALSAGVAGDATQQPLDGSHSYDISLLARQLLRAQQQHNGVCEGVAQDAIEKNVGTAAGLKFKLTRQESYV